MPLLNSTTAPQLAAASIKGYRELLRKLKRDQAAEGPGAEPSTLLQQAKERVSLYRQRKRAKEPLDPRRAFARVAERLLQAKQELKLELRATYAAVRGDAPPRAAEAPAAAPDQAELLGTDGPLRAVLMAGVGALCKAFMNGLCATRVEGAHIMHAALQRPPGQALITVSNHVAALDDPLVTAALLPPGALLQPRQLRWTLCATDRCFTSATATAFFRAAKVLPVERGGGLAQPGMAAAEARLAAGDWVHVFPEGTRSRDGRMGPARRGVGRLVAACAVPPLVVPWVHSGMERIIPVGSKLPRPGADISLLVGDPIDVSDLLEAARQLGWPEQRLYSAIAERIGAALHALKAQLEGLPLSEVVREGVLAGGADAEEALLPLLEQEMDALAHPMAQPSMRQSAGLTPISSRAQHCSHSSGAPSQPRHALSAGPAEAETGPADLCMRLLRGDAVVSSVLLSMAQYAAQRVHATQLALAM